MADKGTINANVTPGGTVSGNLTSGATIVNSSSQTGAVKGTITDASATISSTVGEQGTSTGNVVGGGIGPQGVQGITGPPGPQGATGPVGPQGQVGATGATGAAGSNGLSGYQWEVDRAPVESPNGSLRVFTLPDNHTYIATYIFVTFNGQYLTHGHDFIELSPTTIQLVATLLSGDIIRLNYRRT